MNPHIHTLDSIRHQSFIAENRRDPVTLQALKAGDRIIICENDKIAFLADSWRGQCPLCKRSVTLPHVPNNTQSLQFKKKKSNHAKAFKKFTKVLSKIPKPYSSNNPVDRVFTGIGFGIGILFQFMFSPLLILTFLFHPILSTAKALKIAMAITLIPIIIALSVLIDPVMLVLWAISLGFIRTYKLVIIGYTEELYRWITNNRGFFDL